MYDVLEQGNLINVGGITIMVAFGGREYSGVLKKFFQYFVRGVDYTVVFVKTQQMV